MNIGAMAAMQAAVQTSTRIACEQMQKRQKEREEEEKKKEKKNKQFSASNKDSVPVDTRNRICWLFYFDII